MLKVLLFASLFAFPFIVTAQESGSVFRYIDAIPYAGKKFTIQAAVKVHRLDSFAYAMLWMRADRADKNIASYDKTKLVQSEQWTTISLSGKIDKAAARFFFGGTYVRRGLFWFDDFKLFVEDDHHTMIEVPLPESGFEGDSAAVRKAWTNIYTEIPHGGVHRLTQQEHYVGAQSMLADATRLEAAIYGSNESVGKYVNVGNIRMYYEVYGQGPPVLLLHGNSASIKSFKNQIPALAKKYKVIALDSRGQGKSSEDGTKFTYELFAADTKAFLDQLHLDSVHIVGWSDGGNIGLIMAMKYPEKVKSLVTMGANLYNDNSAVKPYVNKYLREWSARLSDTVAADVFRKRMNELLLHEPNINPKNLSAIHCPVLVTAGSDDLIKEGHTRLIAASIKNAQLIIFPNGTHDEPSEKPEVFNKAVLDFLNANKGE